MDWNNFVMHGDAKHVWITTLPKCKPIGPMSTTWYQVQELLHPLAYIAHLVNLFFMVSMKIAACRANRGGSTDDMHVDAIIQHGYQFTEPHINVLRLLELTGPRQQDESEQQYLTRFLTTRRQMQCCYP